MLDLVVLCLGHTECIESLLQYGVDIDLSTDQSGSPLYTACANQNLSTVRRLLQLGIHISLPFLSSEFSST